jgi:hypothetical protein
MNNNMPQPILITGAARSGTSLVAGTINLCGAFGGVMSGPNRNNAKGMFENSKIRNNIVKPYLSWQLKVDRLGQYPLPNINNIAPFPNLRQRVEKTIKKHGYTGGPWMYKGAKMCLIWPVWHKAFPNAKWIIVRRADKDIAESCMNTGFMKAFKYHNIQKAVGVKNEFDGWMWWVEQHAKRFKEMKETGLQIKEIWSEDMVSGNYKQMIKIIDWLGLEWNADALSFVDPRLWKTRRNIT